MFAVEPVVNYGLQSYTNEHIVQEENNIKKTNICLAGGIFANVLLNQKISKIKELNKLFIHPNMGDGGLATGAAFSMHSKDYRKVNSYVLESVYLG